MTAATAWSQPGNASIPRRDSPECGRPDTFLSDLLETKLVESSRAAVTFFVASTMPVTRRSDDLLSEFGRLGSSELMAKPPSLRNQHGRTGMSRREWIDGLRWSVRGRHLAAAVVAATSFAGLPIALAGPAQADTATLTPAQFALHGGSLANITNLIGAQELWKNGFSGQGVDVAVIDTGVTPVPGLAGKVIDGPDLSLDFQDPDLANLDAFGHGTEMASIIAGSDLPAGLPRDAKKCDTCVNE